MARTKAPGTVTTNWFFLVAPLCMSCQTEPSRPKPEPASSSTVTAGQTSAAGLVSATPIVMAPPEAIMSAQPQTSAAPSASVKAEEPEAYCMTAAESMENAKPHENAPAPYSNCAVGVFSHCGGENGGRGYLCSKALSTKATALARKKKPGVCCYGAD